MKELVRACSIEEHRPEDEDQLVPQLFVRDQPCDHCVLVLTGRLQVVATAENFVSEAGPYKIIGSEALVNTRYKPSFSTAVLEETRLIRIRRSQYRQMIEGKHITDFKDQAKGDAAKAGEMASAASPRNRASGPPRRITRSDSSGNLKLEVAAAGGRWQRGGLQLEVEAAEDEALASANAAYDQHVDTPRLPPTASGRPGPLFWVSSVGQDMDAVGVDGAYGAYDNPLTGAGGEVIEEDLLGEVSSNGGSTTDSPGRFAASDSPASGGVLSPGSTGSSGRRRISGRLQKAAPIDLEEDGPPPVLALGPAAPVTPAAQTGSSKAGSIAGVIEDILDSGGGLDSGGASHRRPAGLSLEVASEQEI